MKTCQKSDPCCQRIRVLLADDHIVVRQGTRQLLERECDIEVVGEADNGEEAVRLAAQTRPDVVIMDVAMPVLDGIEGTKRIKGLLPTTAVLILTGYDYDEFVFALLEAGAAGYLLKSVSGEGLINAVRSVQGGEPVLAPVVVRKVMERFREGGGRRLPEPDLRESLSSRELEVLQKASRGENNKEIADDLSISVRTVQAHLRGIFNKLGVASRSEAVLFCVKKGWVALEELP